MKKSLTQVVALAAILALCVFEIGCSGGGSQSGSTNKVTTSSASTITGISVSVAPSSVTTAQTATCTATVQGTGSFSKDVTWTATGGTMTSGGVFTPTATGTGTCKATSTQDLSFSGSANITVTQAVTSPEGVYSGTTSLGSSFEAIVLSDNSFWALYGTTSNSIFFVQGVLQGSGSYSGANYSASGWDSYYLNLPYVSAFTVKATFVPGLSITGTVSESGVSSSFTATAIPTSSFNYEATPSLSDIAGAWSNGALLGNVPASATIQSNGAFAGLSEGCAFSGTITPDSSGNNFFDVTIKYGNSGCSFPGVTQTGVAVDYLLSDGRTRQLVAAVHDSGYGNNVFIANR